LQLGRRLSLARLARGVARVAGGLALFLGHLGRGRIGERRFCGFARGLLGFCRLLGSAGFAVPVLEVDVRRAEDVRLLLSVLVSMAEAEEA
jgi:hypothetical protein